MSSKYRETLVNITPTKDDQQILLDATLHLVETIKKASYGFPLQSIMPCGSTAKGTNLSNGADIDLFAILKTIDKKLLAEYAKVVGERVTTKLQSTLEIAYADNPYAVFSFQYKNRQIPVNLVPTVFVSKEIPLAIALSVSGMARTPLHTKYAKTNLKGLEGEIRLFKYFCKQKRIYGIFGLTGWLCELLVLYYGSFEETLKEISQWTSPVIDFGHSRSQKALEKKFGPSLLVVVDPIDHNRNAAAGIQGFMGELIFQRLKMAAGKAIEDPTSTFELAQPKGNVVLELRRSKKDVIETTAISLLGGVVNKIAHNLDQFEYKIEDAWIDIQQENAQITMKFNKTANPTLKIQGPPTSMKKASKAFLEKHKQNNPYTEKNRWWVVINSKYPHIRKAIKAYLPRLKGFYELKEIIIKKE